MFLLRNRINIFLIYVPLSYLDDCVRYAFCFSEKLPFSIRVLLESAVRNCDDFYVLKSDVEKILDWEVNQSQNVEIPFKPSRVILQDFT